MSTVVLSSTYAGNIHYFSKIAHFDLVETEVYDNYLRQTYRNRCQIATADGIMDLTIPVEKPDGKCIVRDIKIADEAWQKLHWGAIMSAYNSSPYFEYYEDDLRPFYTQKYKYLADFNQELEECICNLIGCKTDFCRTQKYEKEYSKDFRNLVLIKPIEDKTFKQEPYYQIFKQKYGFIENLSIFDLLLNMGNESILILKKSHVE